MHFLYADTKFRIAVDHFVWVHGYSKKLKADTHLLKCQNNKNGRQKARRFLNRMNVKLPDRIDWAALQESGSAMKLKNRRKKK